MKMVHQCMILFFCNCCRRPGQRKFVLSLLNHKLTDVLNRCFTERTCCRRTPLLNLHSKHCSLRFPLDSHWQHLRFLLVTLQHGERSATIFPFLCPPQNCRGKALKLSRCAPKQPFTISRPREQILAAPPQDISTRMQFGQHKTTHELFTLLAIVKV